MNPYKYNYDQMYGRKTQDNNDDDNDTLPIKHDCIAKMSIEIKFTLFVFKSTTADIIDIFMTSNRGKVKVEHSNGSRLF